MHVLRYLAADLLLAAGVIGAGIVIDDRSAYAAENTSLVVSPGAGSPGPLTSQLHHRYLATTLQPLSVSVTQLRHSISTSAR